MIWGLWGLIWGQGWLIWDMGKLIRGMRRLIWGQRGFKVRIRVVKGLIWGLRGRGDKTGEKEKQKAFVLCEIIDHRPPRNHCPKIKKSRVNIYWRRNSIKSGYRWSGVLLHSIFPSLFGQRPRRGWCPVELRGLSFVCPFVRSFVHSLVC